MLLGSIKGTAWIWLFLCFSETLLPSIDKRSVDAYSPEMLLIPGGTYRMGSEADDRDEYLPRHMVTVDNFYLGKYEVTNGQYCMFLNEMGNQEEGGKPWIVIPPRDGCWDKPPIYAVGTMFYVEKGYENYPVAGVTWHGAKAYCDWLSSKTGLPYRLPTEAEWEYAAGNGSRHTLYSWGDEPPVGLRGGNVADQNIERWPGYMIGAVMFPDYNDGYIYAAPVGQYLPNDFGLYDMTGNVWEWCNDWYGPYYYKNSPSRNPQGPIDRSGGYGKCIRGGAWTPYSYVVEAQVATRFWGQPESTRCSFGFRVARDY